MKQKPMTRAELERLLAGIDETETESKDGWWETFSGADFGAAKLRALLDNDDLWRLKWTKEKPTERGWYWWRAAPNAPADLVLLKENGLCQKQGAGYWVNNFGGQWCGPFEEPE